MVYRFTYKFIKKSVRCNGGTSTGSTMDFGIGQVSRQRYLSCCVKDRAIFSYAVSLLRIRKKELRSFKKSYLLCKLCQCGYLGRCVNQNMTQKRKSQTQTHNVKKIKKATQNHKTESCEKSSLYSDIIYSNIYSVLQLRLTNVLCEKCETGTPQ